MSTVEVGGCETMVGSRPGSHAGSPTDYRAYVYVGLMVIFGSTTAAAARYIVRELPPVWVPVVRFGMSGLLLLPVVADRRRPEPDLPSRLAAAPRRRSDVRPDQPGILPQRRAARPDLARRTVLRDLSPGRPPAGLVIAAGAPRPRPALGRAGERRGRLHHRDRQRLARRGASGGDPRHDARRPAAHRSRPVLGRVSHGQQAARSCDTDRCRC